LKSARSSACERRRTITTAGGSLGIHRPAPENARMRAVHVFLSTIDRATSTLGTILYGPPPYGLDKSAWWRCCSLGGFLRRDEEVAAPAQGVVRLLVKKCTAAVCAYFIATAEG
jgi:hypothetical protein